ncbi:UDP-N-acetylglucosamine 1-carboxyvinyltransferase [Longibacter salinarum]|uniref:UDP-N-acetylglucosamine 1-carboxyvinyltransferase n=1 Tax=Longibacter salinarum TaxID=1850348 RepID=A0A2A8D2I6_9BACT|nr:UDP-N-acetylglucosamine 1-carboxyvinyltransferase [Longibacter salinarum]PEN15023.1 UDP-N-acetylglucosamine 1-carboxyvinyltransferase [Longibacter salinarum]
MDKFVIEGPSTLSGSLEVGGSKNTALPLMAAAILAEGETTVTNVPDLRDVHTLSKVIRVTGPDVTVAPDDHTVTIDASTVDQPVAPYELVKKMRASFYMLGALIGRCGQARVSLPGGCAWGPRPVDLHIEGMKQFGAEIELDEGYVVAKARGGRLEGGTFRMEPSSVGATVNLLLGAVTARGGSRIENAAMEPDVVAFGEALKEMGAQIDGLGTRTIEIQGVDGLDPIRVRNTPDRIEMGTFMILAAMAGESGKPFRITNGNHEHLGQAFKDYFRGTGVNVEYTNDGAIVTPPESLTPVSIRTETYPGFPTDLQAQWTVMLATADGEATVTDTIYDDRFKHIPELQRLGIDVSVNGNAATVRGGAKIKGAQVMSTDLRASVSLVMAGIVAEGRTDVLRIYHLDRGYENLAEKLRAAGATIKREQYDEFAEPSIQK